MSFRRPVQLGVLLIALVVSGSMALAQEQGQQGPTKQPMGNGMSNEQMQMMHQQMVRGSQTSDTTTPTMPGQDAFGAIQEIVRILEADPKTDWSKVNLEALRQHLIDMSEVTLKADAVTKPIDGGIEVTVTGTGRTVEAIQRMVPAQAHQVEQMRSQRLERQDRAAAGRCPVDRDVRRPAAGAAHPRSWLYRLHGERVASPSAPFGHGQGRVRSLAISHKQAKRIREERRWRMKKTLLKN